MLRAMQRFWVRFFVLGIFSLPALGATWRLDSDELQQATLEEADAVLSRFSPSDEIGKALWLQAAGHLALEARQPHAGRKYFLAAEDLCDAWQSKSFSQFQEVERGRANAVCALVEAELATHPFPVFSYFRLQRAQAYSQAFLLSELPEIEKIYATARLRSALPPLGGSNFRSSLFSFRVLERLSPQTKGLNYWLALTFRRQGQAELASESLRRAVDEGDPRAVLIRPSLDSRWGSDESYGITLVPLSSPAKLQGLGVRYWDDRLADGPISLLVSLEGTLRGNFGGSLRVGYQPNGWALAAELEGGRVVRDYFGPGMGGGTAYIGFPTTQLRGRFSFWQGIGFQKTVSFGLVFHAVDVGSFSGAPFSSFLGSFASFDWDNRDRAVMPRNGLRLNIKAKALRSTLGQALVFETVFSAHRTIGLRHTFLFQASTRSAAGSLPVNALSDLYALDVPLAREFRFQDSQAAGAFVAYRWLAAPWLHLGLFGVVGSVGDRWESLLNSPALGAGLSFDLQFERIPRFSPRWEFGNFAGEWIFQTAARVAF